MQQDLINIDEYDLDEEEHQVRDQGNRVKFNKLLQEQWEKMERKNFSQFEVRVLQALQTLGDSAADEIIKTPFQAKQQEVKVVEKVEKNKHKQKEQQKQGQDQPTEEIPNLATREVCVGQEIYLQVIRPKLVEFRILGKVQADEDDEDGEQEGGDKKKKGGKDDDKKKKEKKGGKNAPKKDDLMRIELSKGKVLDQALKMLQTMGLVLINVDVKLKESEFLKVDSASKRIKSFKWLELKFASLMIYADQLIRCHLHSTFRNEYAFELIYFLKNLYIKYQDYTGQSFADDQKPEKLATYVIKDVKRKLLELHKTFGFSNRVLFNKYPKLVIDTDLNQAFQQTDIKPYKAQVRLMETLQQVKKPTLIFLNTMVGTGKTVMSVALATYLQKIRDSGPQNPESNLLFKSDLSKMQFLYCCPLDTVRTQVGSSAYERKIKFAIASMWRDPFSEKKGAEGYYECPRLVNSWANRNEEFPSLIIADFKTTLELLKEREAKEEKDKTVIRWQGVSKKYVKNNPSKSGDQYILFIDEPTVDADFPEAETTQILVEIMRRAPPITILSSATLPAPERIPKFIQFFKKNYGEMDLKEITAVQFPIGCQMFSFDGRKFLPHYRAKSTQHLKQILERLDKNPFMQRCYNANAYCELHDRMKQCGVTDIEDFEGFDLITQEIVQRKSIEILTKLSNLPEEILLKVCSELPPEVEDEPEQQLEDGEEYEYEYEYVYETEQPKNVPTIAIEQEDIMKFTAPYSKMDISQLGGKMAHKFIGGCLITVKDPVASTRKYFHKLLKKCEKASDYVKQYEKSLELLEKEVIKKERAIDNEDERSKQIQQLQESMKLTINFPDFLKINTLEHYKKFVTTEQFRLEQFRARKAFSLEAINYQIDLPDDFLLYLFTGIAAYTEKPSALVQTYYEEVQKLAANGQLAHIVSDDSMCYGVNYPLNHVIVKDEMAQERSIGALFQLIGRAGRVGVSWTANAYLDNKTFDRLVNYLEGNNDQEEETKDEAYNMEQLSKRLQDKLRDAAKQRREQKLQQQQEEGQVQQ